MLLHLVGFLLTMNYNAWNHELKIQSRPFHSIFYKLLLEQPKMYYWLSVIFFVLLNPLNAELNPICHLLALIGAHLILHVSRIRVKFTLSEDIFISS